ncbi:hypothetical protein A0H81_10830 [Grifola frondosa]|uniref:Uncharacterized protein n=1 Tax=Grifola frondosa TaxID=5627 RepID=A0A1C7LWH8_GRIFR|nr:hypothetical protein A0H81_10830 [Grifola frondosa]
MDVDCVEELNNAIGNEPNDADIELKDPDAALLRRTRVDEIKDDEYPHAHYMQHLPMMSDNLGVLGQAPTQFETI